MSHSNYQLVSEIANKQQEINIFIHKLKKIHGFKKGFQNDARTVQTLADGREENVYNLVREKLQEIIVLKSRLGDTLPESELADLLTIGFGPGTRFDQWLKAQSSHREHDKFEQLRTQLLSSSSSVKPDSNPLTSYLKSIQASYIRLQTLELYLQRMRLSDNIPKDDKLLLDQYVQDIKILMGQINELALKEAIDEGPEGLAKLYQSQRFGRFYQNSVIMSEKFKSTIGPRLEEMLDHAKDFSLHFSPSQEQDRLNLRNLITNIRVLPQYDKILFKDLKDERYETLKNQYRAAESIATTNQEVIHGQGLMQLKISTNKLNPSDLIQELLNLDTEIPIPSEYKTWSAAKRSGAIEVMLNFINPALFYPSPSNPFTVQSLPSIYLGHSRQFGAVNPQEFIGSQLLNHKSNDLIFTVLAAISPAKEIKIDGNIDTFKFTAIQKITAYAKLIQAIDEGKLKIGKSSPLDQKRLLAERMIYIMTKYQISEDHPQVKLVTKLISSGGSEKLGKAVRGIFGKKDEKTTINKTIQKLFRDYTSKSYTLEDLAKRFSGTDARDYSDPSTAEVTGPTIPDTPPLAGAGGASSTSTSPILDKDTPPLAGAGGASSASTSTLLDTETPPLAGAGGASSTSTSTLLDTETPPLAGAGGASSASTSPRSDGAGGASSTSTSPILDKDTPPLAGAGGASVPHKTQVSGILRNLFSENPAKSQKHEVLSEITSFNRTQLRSATANRETTENKKTNTNTLAKRKTTENKKTNPQTPFDQRLAMIRSANHRDSDSDSDSDSDFVSTP